MGKGPFGICWAKGPAVFGISGQLGAWGLGDGPPRAPSAPRAKGPLGGHSGAIPNGKQFRVEGHFEWKALISIEGERIIPMKTIPYEL